jgi:RNA polymerase sigma factor (sigma-70 family)
MATNRLRSALNQLQLTLAPPGADPRTDAQLLARFLTCRDEAAFAVLVRRHGPMVLGVCRRVLGHAQDAEDAFQAAFLVLARKAGSLLKGEAVGSWLYLVAYRAALRARAGRARRRAREKQVDEMPHAEVQPEPAQDWRPLLDEELGLLPEKHRAPLVLCDLEGQSHREAARQLGLTTGTLARRLVAGRRLLAERLSRRGVTLSGGALAVALAEGAAAAVPAPWVHATARAATLLSAGEAVAVATPAALLMKEVLRAMLMTKLRIYVATALLAVLLGAGGLAYRAAGQAPRSGARPLTDVEVLRREVEILKLQMEVMQAKVRTQEAELRRLREQVKAPPAGQAKASVDLDKDGGRNWFFRVERPQADLLWSLAEEALQKLRAAKDDTSRQRMVDLLERMLRELRRPSPDPNISRDGWFEKKLLKKS